MSLRYWTFKLGPTFNDDHTDTDLTHTIYDRFQSRLNDELWMYAIVTAYIRALPTDGFCHAEVWIDDDHTTISDDGSRLNAHGFLIPDTSDHLAHITNWLAYYDGLYDLKAYHLTHTTP